MDRRIIIGQFINSLALSDGGPARNALELYAQLQDRDEVSADSFLFNMSPKRTSSLAPSQNSSYPRKDRLWINPLFLLHLARRINNQDKVLIHGYYLPWVPLIALLALWYEIPYFIIPHGSLTAWQRRKNPRKKKIWELTVGWFVRKYSAGFMVGSDKELYELKNFDSSLKVTTIGIGVVMPQGIPARDVPKSPVRLLSLSRIAPKKRLDLSLSCLQSLIALGQPAILTVAGGGNKSDLQHLSNLVRDSGVAEWVQYLGELSGWKKRQAYIDADFFLLPSDDENFAITIAEAASYGIPIIASSNVAAASLLSLNACTIVKPCSGEAMANAILGFLQGDYLQASKSARLEADEKFSWAKTTSLILSVMRDQR
jgi:glycosyltransferase involved in cell wall biosynthesis